MSLKLLKKIRTISLKSNFTDSYRKKCTGMKFKLNNKSFKLILANVVSSLIKMMISSFEMKDAFTALNKIVSLTFKMLPTWVPYFLNCSLTHACIQLKILAQKKFFCSKSPRGVFQFTKVIDMQLYVKGRNFSHEDSSWSSISRLRG